MRMRKKAWARPELAHCPYFISDPEQWKGRWAQWFTEKKPIHLELGCGKGVFLAQLAPLHPEVCYIGVDQSPDVLGVARRNLEEAYGKLEKPVHNVALMAHYIEDMPKVLEIQDQVERIYINFCNPWPKVRHHKRRMTHPNQLDLYKPFLADGAQLHFKTDDDDLYVSTLRYLEEGGFTILRSTQNLHAEDWEESPSTEHEQMFTAQGIPIKAIIALWQLKK
ncbi:tRNA (guanosine(46)-N7)-methyltransferase TrmB [Clostridium merdae]|uniref:tRNA (guanosine(46)-N7)-methyltransferase TrmB n=1 Tax=Clostridium merdae TaxID=1958780 RepID=UPI000A268BC0|nr:tRNA (guanosine(46)-N7)-methyltransferase TrmB [Clostridium merdae]